MPAFASKEYNPNIISKFIVTFLLGFTVLHRVNVYIEWIIVFLMSAMFLLNGLKKEAIKSLIMFGVLFYLPHTKILAEMHPVVQILIIIPIVARMFVLPFMAASFMTKTSDVGSILSSMDKLKISKNISIPIAVMFRFFPAFKQEKANIKMAMKIRGISIKNPIEYIEYVAVPLLIISSNIADDIAKAAETKAIENPIKKTRYTPVNIQAIDFIFTLTISILVLSGILWLK